jgi:phosphoglycolate phosphatase
MAQLETWFHSHFKQSQHAVVELPHARELLESCHGRGMRLFVLSTMHPSHFSVQCAALGFSGYFERTHVGILDKEARIRDLLAEDKVNPVETLMVGDMQHDIDTARRGGLLSCAVLTGYTGVEQLRTSKPDLIVEHLGQLHDRLLQTDYRLLADNRSENS